jgi:hypothetical protein
MTHDTFELHADDNFIFALDVSNSMNIKDCPGDLSRFDYALEKMKLFCKEAAKFEDKGICIFRFGHQVTKFDHITEDKIDDIIASSMPDEMATRTDLVIKAAYDEHVEDKHEHTLLFIVTDGQPTNEQAVIRTIDSISHAVKNKDEFKIIFLLVGDQNNALMNFISTLSSEDRVSAMNLDKVNFMAAVKTTFS